MTPRRGKRDEAIQGPRPETQGGSKKTFASRPAMEARPVDQIPEGSEWQYEPKWDGFRCILTRDGNAVAMLSKSGQDLNRWQP
jgi:ATP-dependent DNA ligase